MTARLGREKALIPPTPEISNPRPVKNACRHGGGNRLISGGGDVPFCPHHSREPLLRLRVRGHRGRDPFEQS